MKSFWSFFWEIFKVFIISAIVVLTVRYFLIQPFFVKGASMEPNYEDGQYLVIDEISYRFGPPERGEVIVFRFPGNTSEFFIKRIIGLPGETVQIKGSQIIIKNQQNPLGFVLNESKYLATVPNLGDETVTLGSDQYFVMGDNRAASFDSRRWGPVPRNDIIGRVWVRAWPINSAGVMTAPAY